MARPGEIDQFVALSAALTGFDAAEVWATGMVPAHFDVIPAIIGADYLGRLLTRWASIATRGAGDPAFLEELILNELLLDETLGPIARNVGTLWYLGMWYQLPAAWRAAHGAFARDSTHVVSSQAYQQALVWKAAHTHPPAAKQQGFGSWALPPEDAR